MYKYFAYNLFIESDFQLPGFTIAANFDPSLQKFPVVQIVCKKLSNTSLNDFDNSTLHLNGTADGVLKCKIINGTKIIVEPDKSADPSFLSTVISGELIAALLRQRGLLVLHGSSVARDGKIIAFLGDSGYGKSTTASYFIQNGYKLVAEDLLVIEMKENELRAVPGPDSIKLRPDSGKKFNSKFDLYPKVYNNTEKRIIDLPDNSIPSISDNQIRSIYVLEKQIRDCNKIQTLTKKQAFLELIKHTRINRWLTSKEFMHTHFKQCESLLSSVEVKLLHRKFGLDYLPEIKTLIENDNNYI